MIEYYYGMKLRGFSPGCQPMEGFVRREDDWTGKFWDVLVYDRELNSIQCDHYDLVLIGMDQARESMLL
jgi:hypothetical protein